MRPRRLYGRLAWSLFASCVLLSGLDLFLVHLNGPTRIVERLAYPLVFLVFAVVGALVASRRPENPIGWIFCVVAITNVIWSLALEYTLYAFVFHPAALPGREVAAWLVRGWISSLGWALMLTFVPLLFPTGRLLSPRWRLAAYLAALVGALQVVAVAFEPGPVDDSLPSVRNPLGLRHAAGVFSVLDQVGSILVFLVVMLCVASLVLRFSRARGEERQQIKWFAYAVVLLTAMVLISLLHSAIWGGDNSGPLWGLVFAFGVVGIPAAAAVAILRYRLYDIDLLINRTLVYATLTVMLALVYLGGVVFFQFVFRAITGEESQLAVVASTLAIAALFGPLRRRIQDAIDRSFYRKKYSAARTLEAFSAKLRDEVDIGTLTDEMMSVIRETIQPAHVSLWLQTPLEDHQRSVGEGTS